MRKLAILFFAVAMAAVAATQETALTIGTKSGPRAEVGKTAFRFQRLLGTKLDLRAWAGAGAALNGQGRPVGSFAALVGPGRLAKGLEAWAGLGYVGAEGKKSVVDLVAHFGLAKDQTTAFSIGRGGFSLNWSKRF